MATAIWTDQERVEEYLNNNPKLASELLTRALNQTQLDALYATMFPPATPERKGLALEKARRVLLRNGYANTTALVQTIDAELAAIEAAPAE